MKFAYTKFNFGVDKSLPNAYNIGSHVSTDIAWGGVFLDKKVSLSDGEWKLMNCLWERAPLTITELVAALKGETDWTKHTVIPTLNRLEAKGAVRYERGERARLYYPSVDRNDVAVAETYSFLAKVHRGRIGLMLSSMIDEDALSKEDIDELSEILNKAEGNMKSSGNNR